MASQVTTCVSLIAFIIANAAPASTLGNFPLKDCRDHDIDMLVLLDNDSDQTWQAQTIGSVMFELSNLTDRWLSATVLDHFTACSITVDVSGWSFRKVNYTNQIYKTSELVTAPARSQGIKSVLLYKIHIVEQLFNKMKGVRSTSIHIGVIFLDGINLTMEAMKNVTTVVREVNSEVKIFLVIFGNEHVHDVIRFTDTIVLPRVQNTTFHNYLLMAMCTMCIKDWVLLEHTSGIQGVSCYHAEIISTGGWDNAMSYCSKDHYGALAEIDTENEMNVLKSYIHEVLKHNEGDTMYVNIGLRRYIGDYTKRFHWVTNTQRYRPLICHNWLPCERIVECFRHDCGVWRFTKQRNNSNDEHGGDFYHLWEDSRCNSTKISYALCEISIPQIVSARDLIKITQNHLTNDNGKLEQGNFVMFHKNMVSVSENVADEKFVQFLKNSNRDFPLFDCGENVGTPRYISYSKVCDFVKHCGNNRDEISCSKPFSENKRDYYRYKMHGAGYGLSEQKLHGFHCERDHIVDYMDESDKLHDCQCRCDNFQHYVFGPKKVNCDIDTCKCVRCSDGYCLPQMLFKDGTIDCLTKKNKVLYSWREGNLRKNISQFFKQCVTTCAINKRNHTSYLDDDVAHCAGPEGPLDETTGKLEPANICIRRSGEINPAPKSTYIKDRYGEIVGCRDMSHVRDCDNYTCGQGYVKCYNSYCIPQHYLLDGKDDCPAGEDEQPLYIGPCTGNFACRDSKVCLHPDHVCDGHPDCPHDDDELDCFSRCPRGFRCVAGTITAREYKESYGLDMKKFSDFNSQTRYLDLSGMKKLCYNDFLNIFRNLNVLILSRCGIAEIYAPKSYSNSTNHQPFMIQKLDISYNMLETIFNDIRYTYYYANITHLNVSYNMQLKSLSNLRFSYLEILDVSYTGLIYLNNSVFVDLPKLQILNLSHTLISDFSGQYFSTSFTLRTLDLRDIRTKDFNDYFFHGLNISQEIYTDYYQICCPRVQGLIISPHACNSPQEVISSCYDLLKLNVQRIMLWILAVVAVLGNITVIVFRIIWDKSVLETGYGLFVTNLGVSDFIMGVYLAIIAGADHLFRYSYVLYDKVWRESLVCKFAGFMATLSCEASTLFAFLITLDRFLLMKFPFGQNKWTRLMKSLAVTWSWVESFVLSLLPIVLGFDIYSSNAMCLGLPLKNKVNGWEYSVGVFLIHNFILFLLIAYGQYAIFRAMADNRVSKTAAGMSRRRRAEDIKVARQLSLVVLSNFLFWFPVGLIGLMSLGGHEVGDEVYAWITVILLPINSAVNPILYTIPAIMARWQRFVNGKQTTRSVSL